MPSAFLLLPIYSFKSQKAIKKAKGISVRCFERVGQGEE